MQIDRHDRLILKALQEDGRIPVARLAEVVGLSATPVTRRIQQLEQAGIIAGYGALLDEEAVGLPVTVFVFVELERQGQDVLTGFEAAVAAFGEVMDVFLLTGAQDYMLRVVARDLKAYQAFLQEKLTAVPGIRSIRSSFALRQVLRRKALPLE